jgi:hypothetical protein
MEAALRADGPSATPASVVEGRAGTSASDYLRVDHHHRRLDGLALGLLADKASDPRHRPRPDTVLAPAPPDCLPERVAAGKYRHWQPVRARNRIASTICRRE